MYEALQLWGLCRQMNGALLKNVSPVFIEPPPHFFDEADAVFWQYPLQEKNAAKSCTIAIC